MARASGPWGQQNRKFFFISGQKSMFYLGKLNARTEPMGDDLTEQVKILKSNKNLRYYYLKVINNKTELFTA